MGSVRGLLKSWGPARLGYQVLRGLLRRVKNQVQPGAMETLEVRHVLSHPQFFAVRKADKR
jgi:hypothetical protein